MQLSGSLTRVLISSLRCKDTNKYSFYKIYRGFFTEYLYIELKAMAIIKYYVVYSRLSFSYSL